jgi:hypothetical protein
MFRVCDLRGVALRFILTIGILSFFCRFHHEGSRSIIGRWPVTSLDRSPRDFGKNGTRTG